MGSSVTTAVIIEEASLVHFYIAGLEVLISHLIRILVTRMFYTLPW